MAICVRDSTQLHESCVSVWVSHLAALLIVLMSQVIPRKQLYIANFFFFYYKLLYECDYKYKYRHKMNEWMNETSLNLLIQSKTIGLESRIDLEKSLNFGIIFHSYEKKNEIHVFLSLASSINPSQWIRERMQFNTFHFFLSF